MKRYLKENRTAIMFATWCVIMAVMFLFASAGLGCTMVSNGVSGVLNGAAQDWDGFVSSTEGDK